MFVGTARFAISLHRRPPVYYDILLHMILLHVLNVCSRQRCYTGRSALYIDSVGHASSGTNVLDASNKKQHICPMSPSVFLNAMCIQLLLVQPRPCVPSKEVSRHICNTQLECAGVCWSALECAGVRWSVLECAGVRWSSTAPMHVRVQKTYVNNKNYSQSTPSLPF